MHNYTISVLKTWKFILVLIGVIFLLFGGAVLSRGIYTSVFVTIFLVLSGLVIGYFLVKKVAVETLQVSLNHTSIKIDSLNSGYSQEILIGDIVSYKYQEVNDNYTFRLRLRSEKKITLNHNDNFCPSDDILAFADQFEIIRATLVSDADSNNIVFQREKTFFEKPVANVIGWLISAGLVYFTWHLVTHGVKDGKWGSVFMFYGNGLAYLGAWQNARNKKSKA